MTTEDLDLDLPEDVDPDDPRPWRKAAKEKAKEAKAAQARIQELEAKVAEVDRREAFAKASGGIEGVSYEDVADLDPSMITPTFLKAKVQEKVEAKQAAFKEQAAALNLTPEQYTAALTRLTQVDEQERIRLAAQGQIAAGSPGAPPSAPKPEEVAWGNYEENIKKGVAQDQAQALYFRDKMMATQAIPAPPPGPSAPAGGQT